MATVPLDMWVAVPTIAVGTMAIDWFDSAREKIRRQIYQGQSCLQVRHPSISIPRNIELLRFYAKHVPHKLVPSA